MARALRCETDHTETQPWPGTTSFEIEAADDFVLGSQTVINAASFEGLLVPGTVGTPSISDLILEI